jgi:MFS family permease
MLPSPSSYYGWRIAWAFAVTQTIGYGVLTYAFGVFVKPMEAELGWSRAETSLAFSINLLVSGLLAYPVGRIVDRYGARWLMTGGSVLGALAVWVWSMVQSLPVFYLVFVAMGVASSATLYAVSFTVLAVWFRRERPKAMLIVTLAAGLASTIFIPLASWLLQTYGWREATQILAMMLALGTIPLHAWVLRQKPQDLGMHPDGAAEALPHVQQVSAGAAVRGATFWWLALSFSLYSLISMSIAAHLVPLLTERGNPAALVAMVAGSVGVMQLVGRIIYTPLSQRLSLFGVSAVFMAFFGVGLAVLLVAGQDWALWVFALFYGMANGSGSLAKAALVAEVYGSRHYGSISGSLGTISTLTATFAPLGAGFLHDLSGDYTLVLWILIAASVVASLAVWQAARSSHHDTALTNQTT